MGETEWCAVTVVWGRLDEVVRDFSEADLATMGEGQLNRFRQLDPVRAHAFLAGRALIRMLLDRFGVADVQLNSRCGRCGDHHAAPRASGIALSVSHAGDVVVVAASREATSIGVDVERLDAAHRVAELASIFPTGAPDVAGWTRIESVVKADGRGFTIEPSSVSLRLQQGTNERNTWSGFVPGGASRFLVTTLDITDGLVISVARNELTRA